jgi:polysaccharide pyruvyl transferase WcaK-like protein
MRITCAAREPVLNLPNGNAYLLLLKKSSLYIICGGKAWQGKKESSLTTPLLVLPYPALSKMARIFSLKIGGFHKSAGQSQI